MKKVQKGQKRSKKVQRPQNRFFIEDRLGQRLEDRENRAQNRDQKYANISTDVFKSRAQKGRE